jgi:hypothetical protein
LKLRTEKFHTNPLDQEKNANIQNLATQSLQSYVSKRFEIVLTFIDDNLKGKKNFYKIVLQGRQHLEVVFSRKFSYVKKTLALKGLGSLALVFLITSRESMAKP